MTVLGQKEITMVNERIYALGSLPVGSEKRAQILSMSEQEFRDTYGTAWSFMLHEHYAPELYRILCKYCTELPEDNGLVKHAEGIYELVDATDTYDGIMCFILETIVEAACQGMCDLECELRALATEIYRF